MERNRRDHEGRKAERKIEEGEMVRHGVFAKGLDFNFMNVTLRGRTEHFRPVAFDTAKNFVRLIEQRLLPHEFKIVGIKNFRATAAPIIIL